MGTGHFAGRTPDRYVIGFGGMTQAIYSPIGTPKSREHCQPFTYTLATTPTIPEGTTAIEMSHDGGVRYAYPDGRYGYTGAGPDVAAQSKFLKGLGALAKSQARAEIKRAKEATKLAKLAARDERLAA